MDSNPHATPQDTIAALRTRNEATLKAAAQFPNGQLARDARLKLALLDQLRPTILPPARAAKLHALNLASVNALDNVQLIELAQHVTALATLRLLAESAGEAVAW